MAVQIQQRRDAAANWTSADPVLAEGEAGWETDTGKQKLGDGVTAWTALAYVSTGGGAEWGGITGTLSDQTDLQAALNAKLGDAPSDGDEYVRKNGAWAVATGGGSGAVDSVNGQTGAVVLTEGDIVASINAQTGTTYTAALTDDVVTMDNAGANTLTIPPNSSVAFPVGCALEVWQKGAGQTAIAAGAGVTILYNSANTLKLKGQNSGCSLRKVATDTWRLIGDMEQV